METIPLHSYDLIKELDKMFPEQSADLRDSDKKVWFKSGQRDVVRFLLTKMLQEEESGSVLKKEMQSTK